MAQQSDHLDDEIDDGGGCLEAAHAASDTRTRRSALKGAVTTLIGMGVIPTATASQPTDSRVESEDGDGEGGRYPDPEDVVIETPPEAERARAISRALTNDEVETLRRHFIEQGWTPTGERVLKTVISDRGTEYYTVTLEFDTGNADETAYILYNGNEDSASGLHSVHIDLSGDGENDHWRITSYAVDDGEITTEKETIENFLGCSNVNWGCVAAIAGSYATLYGSCSICASTLTPPTCAICLGAVGGHLAAQQCPWCGE